MPALVFPQQAQQQALLNEAVDPTRFSRVFDAMYQLKANEQAQARDFLAMMVKANPQLATVLGQRPALVAGLTGPPQMITGRPQKGTAGAASAPGAPPIGPALSLQQQIVEAMSAATLAPKSPFAEMDPEKVPQFMSRSIDILGGIDMIQQIPAKDRPAAIIGATEASLLLSQGKTDEAVKKLGEIAKLIPDKSTPGAIAYDEKMSGLKAAGDYAAQNAVALGYIKPDGTPDEAAARAAASNFTPFEIKGLQKAQLEANLLNSRLEAASRKLTDRLTQARIDSEAAKKAGLDAGKPVSDSMRAKYLHAIGLLHKSSAVIEKTKMLGGPGGPVDAPLHKIIDHTPLGEQNFADWAASYEGVVGEARQKVQGAAVSASEEARTKYAYPGIYATDAAQMGALNTLHKNAREEAESILRILEASPAISRAEVKALRDMLAEPLPDENEARRMGYAFDPKTGKIVATKP